MRLLLEVQRDLGSSLQSRSSGVLNNREGLGVGLPDVLAAIVVLGGDHNLVGDQEGGVEADTELADEVTHHPSRGGILKFVKELRRAGLSDCAQVVDKIRLGHSDTSVGNVQHLVLLVRLDLYCELLSSVKNRFVCDTEQTELVQGIGSVRDKLSEEDILVLVERVDDQLHHPVDLGLEGVLLCRVSAASPRTR